MKSYSLRTQIMHAIIAVMVLSLITVGILLNKIPSDFQDSAYMLHKSFGITVLFLMIFRLYFILKDGRPSYPPQVSKLEARLARTVQYSMYFLLIAMPATGWLMSVSSNHIPLYFGWIELNIPGVPHTKEFTEWMVNSHYWFAWGIGGMVVLHLLGNVKCFFIDKNKVVQSMWNFKRKN